MATVRFVLPVIDLAEFDAAEREKLAAAASGLGCFRVINHGLPAALQAEMKATARSLFDIPSSTKHRNTYDADTIEGAGYYPPHKISPYYETLGIFDAASTSDVHAFCSVLDASPPQRKIICEYVARLHGVVVEVGRRVAESLGLGDSGCSFDDWPCHVKLNYCNYSGMLGIEEEEECPTPTLALPAHTDSGFLAVIQEESSVHGGGMEIKMDGKFVAVEHPPPSGALQVIIGDVGKAWSNGRLRNVEHRVVREALAVERMTVVMFMVAPSDGRVEPHAQLVDSQHPQLYRTFDYYEYRKLRNTSGFLADQLPPI